MGDFNQSLLDISLELFPPLNDILGDQLPQNIIGKSDQKKEINNIPVKKKTRKRKHGPDTICSNCSTQETPEWRHHPLSREIVCNACGLRIRKQIKMQKKNEFLNISNESFTTNYEYA